MFSLGQVEKELGKRNMSTQGDNQPLQAFLYCRERLCQGPFPPLCTPWPLPWGCGVPPTAGMTVGGGLAMWGSTS